MRFVRVCLTHGYGKVFNCLYECHSFQKETSCASQLTRFHTAVPAVSHAARSKM